MIKIYNFIQLLCSEKKYNLISIPVNKNLGPSVWVWSKQKPRMIRPFSHVWWVGSVINQLGLRWSSLWTVNRGWQIQKKFSLTRIVNWNFYKNLQSIFTFIWMLTWKLKVKQVNQSIKRYVPTSICICLYLCPSIIKLFF